MRTNKFDLFAQRVEIGGNGIFLSRVGIEVAVRTTMFAERDVQI